MAFCNDSPLIDMLSHPFCFFGFWIAQDPKIKSFANNAARKAYNDTLKTNIALGREMDEKRLETVTKKAAIFERIQAMPDGFDTVVGERGLKLSAGERQRIAIARALYADPRILLLDEASSALDEETEAEIMDNIRLIADEVTILAITHHKGIIRAEDHVIQLGDNGQESIIGKLAS